MQRIATTLIALMVLTSVAYSQNGISARDATGAIAFHVEFVETTLIEGSVGAIGSGSYQESGTIYHSGEIVEISGSKIALRYGGEVHEFTLDDRTEFCAEGTLSRAWSGFPDLGRATLLIAEGGKTPLRIYDRPLLFKLTTSGTVFIPFECGAADSSLGRDQVREVQELLSTLGYDPGPIDGLPGARTRKAIRAFESDEGLELRGALTPDILKRLKTHPKNEDELEAVSLDCKAVGVSMTFTDGGRKMLPGGIEEFVCGGDAIELDTNRIVDFYISTKEYGKLKFEIGDLDSPNFIFYLSKSQKRMLEKYAH